MATHQLVMQATGLVKRYGQVTALDGADFELRAGEILAVIGDNGAGKSSLIKCLSGATIPDEGQITLDGKPVTAAELEGVHGSGLLLPGSMFALDVLGGTVQSTGLGLPE